MGAKNNTAYPICTVYSLDLMNWLGHRGFSVRKVLDGETNPRYKIFIYEDSAEIQQSIGEYIREQRNKGV